jgi:hypothetical protein
MASAALSRLLSALGNAWTTGRDTTGALWAEAEGAHPSMAANAAPPSNRETE